MSRERLIVASFKEVKHFREILSLLAKVDKIRNPELLLLRAVDEVEEAAREREDFESGHQNLADLKDEYLDILVFLLSNMLATGVVPSNDWLNSNGTGNRSGVYEDLIQVIYDSIDDPRALKVVISRYASMVRYSPGLSLDILEQIKTTLDKVMANRPPEFYTTYCRISQRELNPDEILMKYDHLETMFRMLRDFAGKKRLPAHLTQDPEINYLLHDWVNSLANRARLKEILSNKKAINKAEMAGGVPVGRPASYPDANGGNFPVETVIFSRR